MKKLLFLFCVFQGAVCFSQYVSGEDEICGGTTEEYSIIAAPMIFHHYYWAVTGGTFSNGQTTINIYDVNNHDVEVTWNYDQYNINSRVSCVIYHTSWWEENPCHLDVEGTSVPHLYSFEDEESGDLYITPGSKLNYSIVAFDAGRDNSYQWEFEPVGGSTESYNTATPTLPLSLSTTEYGELTVSASSTECNTTSEISVNIERRLASPTNWELEDEIICNNSVSEFSIDAVPYATSYYWEVTGGFELSNGYGYQTTPFSTVFPSIDVKAPSTNGDGSISVTPKREWTSVLDGETLSQELWSGVFYNTYVTGTAAVCHNSLYVYTAVPPIGSPSSYSYSWPTKPSGWYTYSQWTNNIQVQSPTLPENMTYGPIRAKIQNECGWSTEGGITLYPGYNCGGYYKAAPNPAGEYTEIDIASEEAKSLEASYESKITLTVVDKMGSPVMKEVVYDLPYRLNTSKFPKGEYLVQIISEAKDRETRVEGLKIIVNH